MWERGKHDETVVLLSHRKADDYVEMEINNDEFPITSAEMKATYLDIKDYVMKKYNVKISSLEVAQMKQKYGIIERDNYNKKKDNSKYLQPNALKKKKNIF